MRSVRHDTTFMNVFECKGTICQKSASSTPTRLIYLYNYKYDAAVNPPLLVEHAQNKESMFSPFCYVCIFFFFFFFALTKSENKLFRLRAVLISYGQKMLSISPVRSVLLSAINKNIKAYPNGIFFKLAFTRYLCRGTYSHKKRA